MGLFQCVYRWYYIKRYSLKGAIQYGNRERVEKLLKLYVEKGVLYEKLVREQPISVGLKQATPLMVAYLYGEGKIVDILIRHGSYLTEAQAVALLKLCHEDRFYYYPKLLLRLLQHSNLQNEELLIYACLLKNYELAEDLLMRGIDPNCPTGQINLQTTPLAIAAESNDCFLLNLLLRHHAKPSYKVLIAACLHQRPSPKFVASLLKGSTLSADIYLNDKRKYLFHYLLHSYKDNHSAQLLEIASIMLERNVVYYYLIPKYHKEIFAACRSDELKQHFLATLREFYPNLVQHY